MILDDFPGAKISKFPLQIIDIYSFPVLKTEEQRQT